MTPVADYKPMILIVEDQPLVRISVAACVADAGWEPLEAESAEEAEELIKLHPETRILFTDVNIAGSIDGLQLARRVNESHPEVGLIVTSGAERLSEEELPNHGSFISKPYREAELLALLQRGTPSLGGAQYRASPPPVS
jgi:DNA-binding NtrC family response regulator